MTKKNNKKGFTLAELLVVVAIIAVLVAVSIPIFTAQLSKARLATNQANARAGKAAAIAESLTSTTAITSYTYDAKTGTKSTGTAVTTAADLDITSWTTTTMGTTTYYTWTYTLTDGAVTAIAHE